MKAFCWAVVVIWASWQATADAQVFKRWVVLESQQPAHAQLNQLIYEGLLAELPPNVMLTRLPVAAEHLNQPHFWTRLASYDWWIGPLDKSLGDLSGRLGPQQQLLSLYPLAQMERPLQTWIFSLDASIWLQSALRRIALQGDQWMIIKQAQGPAERLIEGLIESSAQLGVYGFETADYSQLTELQTAVKQALHLDRAQARCQRLGRKLAAPHLLECHLSPRQDLQRLIYLGEQDGLVLLLSLLDFYDLKRPIDWLVLDAKPFRLPSAQGKMRVNAYPLSANFEVSWTAGEWRQTRRDHPLSLWGASAVQIMTRLNTDSPQVYWDVPLGRYVREQGVFYPMTWQVEPGE